ncbi:winged helix-turn-helix domain-containing protein [Micromonospora sp. CPCC 206061]|uniref:winged helix-turn-helix domain-containing protein n=1 Tax=Micromonospora sp. CPCC 206061 TaxID=3122410 RepID=UPI003FA52AC5
MTGGGQPYDLQLLRSQQGERAAAPRLTAPKSPWTDSCRCRRGRTRTLHPIGFSPQIPKHRPVERDEETAATWRREAPA